MHSGAEVIDADGHVWEPVDLWDRYIDREFYGVRPIINVTGTSASATVSAFGKVFPRGAGSQSGPAGDADNYRAYARDTVGEWYTRYQQYFDRGWTADCYIEAMDAEGIDRMIFYPSKGLWAPSMGDADGRLSSAICHAYNRWLHDFCSAEPGRLYGAALLALHDPSLAIKEAEYAISELGLKGIMIRPNPYSGRNLEDRDYDDFYEAISELDVPLATHEGAGVWMPEYGDRYQSGIAPHAMCHPMEQMGAVYSFTAGGVMERHPHLRVAILEAGGSWLPYWLYRLDEHVEWQLDLEKEGGPLSMMPSEYFRRQGWISCEADEPSLRGVVDYVGADRLIWASDFPHPDGKYPGAVDVVFNIPDLSKEEIAAYAGANAKALYKLD
jgi:predicted TIM-barrel fold metal-dependent hydrolase